MPSSSSFVEIRLFLDLDAALVDTHINVCHPRVAQLVDGVHHFGAYGKVSRGRFVVAISCPGLLNDTLIFRPLFVKTKKGEWEINSQLDGIWEVASVERMLQRPIRWGDLPASALESLLEPISDLGVTSRGPVMMVKK